MKKYSFFFMVSLILIGSFLRCAEKEKKVKSPRIRKLTKIEKPKYNSIFTLGDSIDFQVASLQDTISIDSFLVKNGDFELFNSTKPTIRSIYNNTGKVDLRYVVFLSNGKKEYHSQKITFLSNKIPETYTYRKVNTYHHDPEAYTQGLIFEDGYFYESTGRNGESSLRKVELSSGEIIQKVDISSQYFGEGLAQVNDKLFMLTYHSMVGFQFDKNSFEQIKTFQYFTESNEGWGLASIGDSLVMSDGTENLYFLDPETMEETSRIQVYDESKPVHYLNELELVNGKIYANIYQTDEIAIIDPNSGMLLGRVNLKGIFDQNGYNHPIDVLNGIAYDQKNDRLFVTGKWWPELYEIDLIKTLNP